MRWFEVSKTVFCFVSLVGFTAFTVLQFMTAAGYFAYYYLMLTLLI